MNPTTEKRIANFLAITLGALVPVLAMGGQPLASGICGAFAMGIAGAYNVRTAADRAAAKQRKRAIAHAVRPPVI